MTESKTQNLREEFNRWAEAGRGEGMERDHLPITLPVIAKMQLAAMDNVLDVGCGTGWLSRKLAQLVPEGRVIGMDISDEMIRVARRTSQNFENIMFVTGEVGEIPWDNRISSRKRFPWNLRITGPTQRAGIRELFRVMRPGGRAWILINYYKDNVHCHQWGDLLAVKTHLLSADEWCGLFRAAGFSAVAHERIADPSPSPEEYNGRWFRDAAQLKAFKAEGALLVHGR